MHKNNNEQVMNKPPKTNTLKLILSILFLAAYSNGNAAEYQLRYKIENTSFETKESREEQLSLRENGGVFDCEITDLIVDRRQKRATYEDEFYQQQLTCSQLFDLFDKNENHVTTITKKVDRFKDEKGTKTR